MPEEKPSDDKTGKRFFDLRAGAPTPVARRDPASGWAALAGVIEADADGYVTTEVKPGSVAIPDGTAGRVTLRLAEPGSYEVTLGSGEYHLVFEVHSDDCEISLGFVASGGPRLSGASFGPYGVSPSFSDANLSGLTHLEFSAMPTGLTTPRHVTLSPGFALLARAASLWLMRTGLTLIDLPKVEGGLTGKPVPIFLTGSAELVLAFSVVELPETQEIPRVRVVASHLPMAGLTADIDQLHVAAGCRYSLPSDARVRSCTLHQDSRLRMAPYSHLEAIAASVDPRNEHLSLDEYPPTVEVASRVDRRVSSVGTLIGPARVLLNCVRPHGSELWRPGELWIMERAEGVHVAIDGWHCRKGHPPTISFRDSSYGRSVTFEVRSDDRGERQVPMHVGLHMEEGSGVYDARGEVLLRQVQGATIDGAQDEGLGIVGLAPAEANSWDEPESEDATSEVADDDRLVVFAGARATDIRLDLTSGDAPQLLQGLRDAEVFDAHPATWSATGQPLGLPALNREETPRRSELWLTPRTERRSSSHSSRQHDLSLALLGEVTRERGRSGTVRSGVARAALVRRQQRTRYWPEHALLLAGRPLGFGYLIFRALVIWIVISAAVAAIAMAERGGDASWSGLVRFVDGALNVAAEPLGIIRGVRAETWLESQVSADRHYLATFGRAIVAVPLVSMFVAIARRSRSGPR